MGPISSRANPRVECQSQPDVEEHIQGSSDDGDHPLEGSSTPQRLRSDAGERDQAESGQADHRAQDRRDCLGHVEEGDTLRSEASPSSEFGLRRAGGLRAPRAPRLAKRPQGKLRGEVSRHAVGSPGGSTPERPHCKDRPPHGTE